MSYPTVYTADFPEACRHIILKKCSVCFIKDIPPVNRKGKPITRQSKYDERKTCGEECYCESRQNSTVGRPRVNPLKQTEPSAIDMWLAGRTGA
jgi:hypothetical protein